MAIKLSDLPPDLRRIVMAEAGLEPAARVPRPRVRRSVPRLSRVCSCLFEMFRPDGIYPERCDGCGAEWPGS